MKTIIGAAVLAAAVGTSAAALADPYKDWTPMKGAWEVVTLKVDPNHIDDYLTGLKDHWVRGAELAKKHGVIDTYFVKVRLNPTGGANVLLIEHYPSLVNLEPDKARDMAMQAEALAQVSKEAGEKAVAGFDKYRTFVSDEIWTDVEFAK